MRKVNKYGCIPAEDVCIKHDEPLQCRHGCCEVTKHTCRDLEGVDYKASNSAEMEADHD